MNNRLLPRAGALAAAAGLAIAMAACGSDDDDADDDTGMDDTTEMEETQAEEPDDDMAASGEFGEACDTVPSDGEGSFEGMADDPVATAAGNNPALTTLVEAVGEADLADTLNTAEDITVFAPVDDAFSAIPEEDLEAVMSDQDMLTDILTYHVVGESVAPEDLGTAGPFETLQGDTVEVEGSGEDFTVNGEASVVCGNVQTANATVYLIDAVLMPAE